MGDDGGKTMVVSRDDTDHPILHVVVVGFHHKKGCQVEYAYPPLIEGNDVNSSECPEEWKHLPSLALPDGAHNYAEDTVYFHLASRTEEKFTIYCVSCYRQMNSTDLINRGSEVTRNSVQKSVCVLSRLPAYGLIQTKLEMITHAYFKGRDFSQVELLRDTYLTLNMSISEGLLQDPEILHGLSCRELLQQFQHRVLILFKLMLLERRVLFFSSPVKPVCKSLLTILSLFPGMIEHGLMQSVCPARPSTPKLTTSQVQEGSQEYLDVSYESSELPLSTDQILLDTTQPNSDPTTQKNDFKQHNVDLESKNNNSIPHNNDSSTRINDTVQHGDDSSLSIDVNQSISGDHLDNVATGCANVSNVSENLNGRETEDIVKLKRFNRNTAIVHDQLVLTCCSSDVDLEDMKRSSASPAGVDSIHGSEPSGDKLLNTDVTPVGDDFIHGSQPSGDKLLNTDVTKHNEKSSECLLAEKSCQQSCSLSDVESETNLVKTDVEAKELCNVVGDDAEKGANEILPCGNTESLLIASTSLTASGSKDGEELANSISDISLSNNRTDNNTCISTKADNGVLQCSPDNKCSVNESTGNSSADNLASNSCGSDPSSRSTGGSDPSNRSSDELNSTNQCEDEEDIRADGLPAGSNSRTSAEMKLDRSVVVKNAENITPESRGTKSIDAEEMEKYNEDELLEKDDDIDWEVDNLLLEINEVLDNPDESSSYAASTNEQPQSLAGAVSSRISGSLSSLQRSISVRTNELWERANLGPRTSDASAGDAPATVTESEETNQPQSGVSNIKDRIMSGLWGGRVSRSLDDSSSTGRVASAEEAVRTESRENLAENLPVDAGTLTDATKEVLEDVRDASVNRDESILETSFSLLGESVQSELSDVIIPFEQDECGMPLGLFTKGSVCHPYISLHLYDILTDTNIKGLVIGASNALFKQKNLLFDVIVEPLDARLEINDPELRRQLSLSTADLRFADFLVRSISDEKGDIFLDETEWSGWEGGDDWLRTQFRTYLLSMLSAASLENDKLCEDYNSSFMTAWKNTNNYKLWKRQSYPAMKEIIAEHPFHGQLSMSDVKLKFSQVMQSADRNKKLNSVVNQTNQVVTQTGKAVGGAITSAKSAMITWFGGFSGSKA